MVRIFFAVSLSKEVKNVLRDVQHEMRSLPGKIKWVDPEQCHLTLKFVGEVEPGRPRALWEAVEELDLPGPFRIELESSGVFPNPRRPRVLWVGIRESDPLSEVANSIDRRLNEEGISREKRDFHPHLTVGRVKNGSLPGETMERFLNLSIPAIDMQVDSIVCYESDLQPGGAVYSALHTIPLGE